MKWVEWSIWIILSWFTIVSFITWLSKKRRYSRGCFYDSREVVALHTIPRVVIAWTILLAVFLFVDATKLHLLWVYPSIYILVMFRMSRKVVRQDEEQFKE